MLRFSLFIFFSLFLIAGATPVYSNSNPDSPTTNKKEKKKKKFASLDTNQHKFINSSQYNSNNEIEFDEEYLKKTFPISSSTNTDLQKAIAAFVDLENSGNFIDFFDPNELVSLPVGIKKDIGNITYSMGIIKSNFTTEYSEVTVFVKIIIPQKNQNGNPIELFFGADNVKLSHKGGLFGTANLFLLGDVPIPINGGNGLLVLNGGLDMRTGNVTSETFVSIDCGGFKEMGVAADVLFPRSMLEPVDSNYNLIPDPAVKVTGHFKTIVNDWNNILAEINLPPFQLTKPNTSDGVGKGGIVFELNTAVFDFSDLHNSANIHFPEKYQEYLIPGNENLWRGVYINSLKIILPEQFEKKNSKDRVRFEANHLLIDGMGVSGQFAVDNLLPLSEGSASGWQFSVDHFEMTLVTNSIVGAGFNGQIVLPTSKEVLISDTPEVIKKKILEYDALIDTVNEDYSLTVSPKEDIDFNLFQARVKLAPNSYVQLRVIQKTFKPKAVLYGEIALSASSKPESSIRKTIDFKGIRFENLQLQTETPYFQAEYLGYEGQSLFANFPVTISSIGITAINDVAALHFDLGINFMGEESGFAGKTSISIIGNLDKKSGSHRWKYKQIKTDQVYINADLGSVKMEGYVSIKDDDPVYGNGFYGELLAEFNDIKVSASAWFGKTEFRYWYVDAFADLSKKDIKIKIGPANINGFGGGAYYHMSKSSRIPPQTFNGEPVILAPLSPSGQDYKPDKNTSFGFRALLGFALESEKAFNGKVGFEMAFNRHGGLDRVFFFGEGHMMKSFDLGLEGAFKEKLKGMEKLIGEVEGNPSIDQLKKSNLTEYSKKAFPQDELTFDIGIDAHFSMEMDFQNRVFHSEMEVYVNTPGNFFSGVGANGRSGWAVFHAAPDQWYIHVGTPKDRIGLRLGINDFSLRSSSYLMMGTNIPESPPPPSIVSEISRVDKEKLDYMRELNTLGSGRGFAFGMDLSIDTGDMAFLIFYAKFQAGMGFDIMIKDYGQTACKGGGIIGINGWYANGQAYAYLQGELGIRLKLFGSNKKIPILKTGATLLLQAKLPNPSWFRGYLAGYYDVLGGLVKGSYRFKVEIGQECELVGGGPLDGLKIISDFSPSANTGDVDVFTTPQVAFNMKINTPFEFEDDQGVKTYRILLNEFKVTEQGNAIQGELEWNQHKDVVNFVSHDLLPPNTNLKAAVRVTFQEQRGGNWVTLTNNGSAAQEQEERSFTTGEAPTSIPLRNISYCYPVIDQKYFHKNERNSGYVKLDRGQDYLFHPQSDWRQGLEIIGSNGVQKIESIQYNASQKLISFSLPELQNNQKYSLRIISKPPKNQNQEEQDTQYDAVDTGQEGNTIEIRNRQAQTVTQDKVDTELLAYEFRTSAYNTFAEKISAKKTTSPFVNLIASDVYALVANVTSSEAFDLIELRGNSYTNFSPLIQVEATLDDAYYKRKIRPLLYKNYPLEPSFTVNRDPVILGVPPKKAFELITWYLGYLEQKPNSSFLKKQIPYQYNLPFYYKQDFIDIQYKIVNTYLNDPERYQNQIRQYNQIINGQFPLMTKGKYGARMQYILPGGISGSSSTIDFENILN